MKWSIIADSSCDLSSAYITDENIRFRTIPFIISVGENEYTDNEELDVELMMNDMENSDKPSSSACPSPHMWEEEFKKADNTIAITVSSSLSGSHNSASIAKEHVLEEYPDKNIHILDSLSTGPECAMCILQVVDWIKQGLTFDDITEKAEKFLHDTHTAFALCSFDNLIKNGRMNKIVGFIAKTIGIWGVGTASSHGTIFMKGKARGITKAISIITDYMHNCKFSGGSVMISHCFNSEIAERLKAAIIETWPTSKIAILATRGLDSYYAERGGLIVAFK